MQRDKNMFWYIVVICISLLIIFFVGKRVESGTGKTSWIVTPNGLQHFKKGMDVAGGVRLTYKIDFSKYREIYTNPQEFDQVTNNVQDIILQNIDTRVSSLGVSDYNSYIQSLNDGVYAVVELGGVSDLDEAKRIIGKTVELEFKLAYEGDGSDQRESRQLLAEDLLVQTVNDPELIGQLGSDRQGDNIYYNTYNQTSLDELPPVYQQNSEIFDSLDTGEVYPMLIEGTYGAGVTLVDGDTAQTTLSGRVIVKYNGSSIQEETNSTGEVVGTGIVYDIEDIFIDYKPLWVTAQDPKTDAILNGAFFKYANVGQSQTAQPVAIINFDERGKEIFCNITETIIGKNLAIFVGGEMVTAPVIREKICGGSAQIDGQFSVSSAKELVDELNEGALPAPLILAHEEKVSPTLGDQALTGALRAGLVGLILIYLFMLRQYGRKQSSVAIATLLAFLIVLFAILKLFGAALSLSGIAAILLSIGMGVDANVLIYERIREELKDHKSEESSIVDGYERSRSAIRDGNVTTGMIAILLFFMGTNVFKGFGTMMIINILLTLFLIVPLTRSLLLALGVKYPSK